MTFHLGTFDELIQQGGHFSQLIAQFQSEYDSEEHEEENALIAAAVAADAARSFNPQIIGLLADADDNDADGEATAPNPSAPHVSNAVVQSPPQQLKSHISVDEARERRRSSSSNAKSSNAVPKPSTDNAKLMTEEGSASGAHI